MELDLKPINPDGADDGDESSDSDKTPDVEDIKEIGAGDNHANCISDNIGPVLEVFDEETCARLLIGYYDVYKSVKLNLDDTKAKISGCEFDYSSNTYRLMVELSSGTVTVGENFIIVKIDGATGFPKVLSIK